MVVESRTKANQRSSDVDRFPTTTFRGEESNSDIERAPNRGID